MSLQDLRAALYDFEPTAVQRVLETAFVPDAPVHLAHPFETLEGPTAFWSDALAGLYAAWPDLERRETIVIEGDSQSARWIGCCGYYTGTSAKPWLGIPATGHQVAMRFHEFFRLENGKVAEMQALWDIPEVMMQAGVWPMAPSLGREWMVPGPATQDGCAEKGDGAAAVTCVTNMLTALGRFKDGGLAAMDLPRYWHPKCSWYGPSGIGTGRGISGFRNWHQIPFLNAMPNRVGDPTGGHLFGQGNYVSFTAWPGMQATISNDGWLGIAPSGQEITLRSLDFWRVERGLIRENWVLVDLLHVFDQIGVDVMARMQELSRARTGQMLD